MEHIHSVYVHVPFCRHRCGYCNFTLIAARPDLVPDYLTALRLEIEASLTSSHPIDTLFLGGGTPSFLSQTQLQELLGLFSQKFLLTETTEFSCEVNPLDCSIEKLQVLADAGVNRVSIGGQSFSARKLKLLERDHSGDELKAAIERCQKFFERVSLDLIFATPEETLDEWERDLQLATQTGLHHLSTYGLTVEKGSFFYGRVRKGELVELDAELHRELYEHTLAHLSDQGWTHYEVSNFALNHQLPQECRHNQAYWQGKFWWGFGPGAASFLPLHGQQSTKLCDSFATRNVNHQSTTQYIKRRLHGLPTVAESETITREQYIRERVVFGLRQLAGINLADLSREFEFEVRTLFEPKLSEFLERGWLMLNEHSQLQLSHEGLFISDGLWPDFLG